MDKLSKFLKRLVPRINNQRGETDATGIIMLVVCAGIALCLVITLMSVGNVAFAQTLLVDNGYAIFPPGTYIADNTTGAGTANTIVKWINPSQQGNASMTENSTAIQSSKNFYAPNLTVSGTTTTKNIVDNATGTFFSGNLTIPTMAVTNIVATQINSQAVPSGALVGYTNLISGVAPTANYWDTPPTSLSNATDGSYTTSTTYGVNNSVANGASTGNFYWDLGSVKKFSLRGSITENVSVTGMYTIVLTTSDDFVSFNYPVFYYSYPTAAALNQVAFGPIFCNTRHLILSIINNSGSASKIMIKLNEAEALDDGW